MIEKTASDAPVWYGSDEASAWANGYNAGAAHCSAVSAEPIPACKNCRHKGSHLAWRCNACGFEVNRSLPTEPQASAESEPVADTWLVGGRPDLMAMSGDVESDRVIKLHFRRPATDQDRKWLLEAINAKLAGTEPQAAPSDIERAFQDACDEAGCAYDNEALLEAIHALKERCQAESASQAVKEPDAWEWRYHFNGRAGAWIGIDQPIARFRENEASNLENGTYELRPLYAGEPLALSRPLRPDERAMTSQERK